MDNVNCDIVLQQEKNGLKYGTDAYLLYAFMPKAGKNAVCEGGCGSGIISLLLLKSGKCGHAVCIDVQDSSCEIAKNNALQNGLSEKMTVVCSDILDFRCEHEFDAFLCNPPYMKENSGKTNTYTEKYIARHETTADIGGFADCAYRVIKDGADAYFVYRPDRCADIIYALKQNKLEPKIITFVHATKEHEPCLMLIKAKKNAKSGMLLTKPLIIYEGKTGGEYSSDMKYIYENGMFPSGFFR